MKKGDIVGYVFAQPGNDTTYLVLTDVRETDVTAWDIVFCIELESVRWDCLWLATERELQSKIDFVRKGSNTTYSIQQLADRFFSGEKEKP